MMRTGGRTAWFLAADLKDPPEPLDLVALDTGSETARRKHDTKINLMLHKTFSFLKVRHN